jgi:nitroreductase
MGLREALSGRRSVREYLAKPVPRNLLEEVIEAATWAPSAMNEQPWRFTVVSDRALMDSMSARAKAYLLSANLGMPERLRFMLADRDFQIFHRAPVLVVISAPVEIRWRIEDCSLAAANFMLAAHAYGLGSCWIGFAQDWLATPDGAAAIELPKTMGAVAPIAVGWPRALPDWAGRLPPQIHWMS